MKRLNSLVLAAVVAAVVAVVGAPTAKADAVAYLVNVTVRPGYNSANADQALAYGYGVCDKIAAGRIYPQLIGDLKADFNTSSTRRRI